MTDHRTPIGAIESATPIADLGAAADELKATLIGAAAADELKIERSALQSDIFSAILEAQKNFLATKMSGENKHFNNKYSTLKDDLDAALPALHAQGIVYSAPMISTELGIVVRTIFYHPASETNIQTEVPLLMSKQGMQDLKSASTYARRIGFENLAGLATSEDDDADSNRANNTMGAAIQDAWKQSVLDSIPETATPKQKAEAFAEAMCVGFKSKTGTKALSNEWDRRRSLTAEFEARFPKLHEKVVDAYENRLHEIEPSAHGGGEQ